MSNAKGFSMIKPGLLILVVGGCAAPPPTIALSPVPLDLADAIEMETTSWGKPVVTWRVERSGEGTYRTVADGPGNDFYRYKVATRKFRVDAEAYRQLYATLTPLEKPSRGYDCGGKTVTDAASTTVVWHRPSGPVRGGLYHGDYCEAAKPSHNLVSRAHELVAGWAKDAPVVQVEDVGPPPTP